MCKDIQIREERISSIEYIEFLKRTDLGAQYPKERFEERIATLVDHVSISLVARNRDILKPQIWNFQCNTTNNGGINSED